MPGQEDFVKEMPMKDHGAAIRIVIELLTQGNTAVLTSLSEIDAVGHRVLHGGAEFTESVIVDDRVIDAIRKCIPLGPLTRQSHRDSSLFRGHGRNSTGSSFRYCFPPDNAGKGLSICSPLRVL